MSTSTLTRTATIALAGNPNCGKTTVFNALTGSRHKVGNWPGVTVERKTGTLLARFQNGDDEVQVVDLPGIYALSALSEDEKVARDYLLADDCDLIVNLVDATNLERNLYLSLQLLETGCPLLMVLTMADLARKQGVSIDEAQLSKRLGVPVIAVNAQDNREIGRLAGAIEVAVSDNAAAVPGRVDYGSLEPWIQRSAEALQRSGITAAKARGLAVRLLEREDDVLANFADRDVWIHERNALEQGLGEEADVLVADARYAFIGQSLAGAVRKGPSRKSIGERLDRLALNRVAGIPVFMAAMFLVFWATTSVGGAFIDFFDQAFGALLVDGLGNLMASWGSPDWLIALLAGGVGAGLQTVSTFIPIIFVMFLMLSILEESGYMARAAFVMDRLMRKIGLPGKAFVPMILGLGCTIPAIMATRTLDTRRDRFTTIFMAPLMSCGARLPVYALFTAAIFGAFGGLAVFGLYLAGLVISILTGLLVKRTLFKGSVSHFVMELPAWRLPRPSTVLQTASRRTGSFVIRAGGTITVVVLVLAFLNGLAIGPQGISFGHEDQEDSVLASIGRAITPAFEPMGIKAENWPATVGLFTGLFAKEAVVGTVNSLYLTMAPPSEEEHAAAEDEAFDLGAALLGALQTIPDNLAGSVAALADPLGLGIIAQDEAGTAAELEIESNTFVMLRRMFSPAAAFAYLLFVLIYFPCVAALGAAAQELGKGLAIFQAVYLTVLAWAVSTLAYQLSEGFQVLWIAVALLLLGGIVWGFRALGRSKRFMAKVAS